MVSKPCKSCGQVAQHSVNSDGTSRAYCKQCSSNKVKLKQQKTRDYLSKVKTDSGCIKCGYNSHPAALQFNHINPDEKEFTIAAAPSKSISRKRLDMEIAKCEILCANCHSVHTFHTHWSKT